MKRNQLILISACAVLFIAIYLFGNTKKPADANAAAAPMGGHAPAQQQAQAAPEALDIDLYITTLKSQAKQADREKIEAAEKDNDYKKLVELYGHLDKPLAVAYFATKEAEKENTVKQYISAGDYNATLLQTAPDDKARRYLTGNMVTLYKHAVDLDSANATNRIKLAGAYMEEGSQPMNGVLMLLDVVKKDSNNVDAQLMLGRFGLISGQIDKAIARFEKVLYLQPQNSEALFLLAEAYNDKGDKQKAIDLLERCEKTVKDPSAKKDIEKAITNIKQAKS